VLQSVPQVVRSADQYTKADWNQEVADCAARWVGLAILLNNLLSILLNVSLNVFLNNVVPAVRC